MSVEFSFDELKNITLQVKEDKKQKLMERVNLARNDAINHITQGCYEKMKASAEKGQNSADIYSFEWVTDKDIPFDSNDNKIIFDGGIRLLDLLKKDHKQFFDDLNKFFNKNENGRFHCGFRKEAIENKNKWFIYVSWAERKVYEEIKQEIKNDIKHINKRFQEKSKTYHDLSDARPTPFYHKTQYRDTRYNKEYSKDYVKEYKKKL